MPNRKTSLVVEAERKHVRRRARFQQHRDASCHQVSFFFLQDNAPKEIHAILTETLGEYAPSYAAIKNCVAQFKRGDFSTYVAPRSVTCFVWGRNLLASSSFCRAPGS